MTRLSSIRTFLSSLLPALLRGGWLCGLLWLTGGINGVEAQTLPPRRVVIVLVPGLRAADLTHLSLPGLMTLRAEGAVGWMTGRAAHTSDRAQLAPDGRDTSASLSLTLGSGARAVMPVKEETRRREDKETRRQGDKETEKEPIGNPQSAIHNRQSTIHNLQSIIDANRLLDHAVSVGALGELIHRQGWQTAVCGSVDTEASNEDGLLLTMDSAGQIDSVQTGVQAGQSEIFAPYGRQDDVAGLLRAVTDLPPRYALIVVVFGDLERADRYGPLCLPRQRELYRDRALRSFDALLVQLRQRLTESASRHLSALLLPPRLFLLAPAPARSTSAEDRLVPFLIWGRDVPAGVLNSPSTRTPGVVVNTDFLPTVADAFHLAPPPGAIGRPISAQPSSFTSLNDWRTAHDRCLQSERLKNVYGGLPTLQLLLTVGALGLFHRNQRRLACMLVTMIVALPLGMLLLPAVFPTPLAVGGAGVALAGFALLFAVLAWRCYIHPSGVSRLLYGLFLVLLAVLTLDLVSGSLLLRQAWMSYSVLETARFYGIGNEYMGVVIGAMCIVLGEGRKGKGERGKAKGLQLGGVCFSLFPFVFSLPLLFLLGYNQFGTKVGAIPSAGVAWGVELLILWRGKLRVREVVMVGGGTLVLLGLLAWLDMRHSLGAQSHLARAFAGSGGSLVSIARRKLLLEGYLLLHSPWSAALLGAAVGQWSVVSGQWSEQGKREGVHAVDRGKVQKRRRGEGEEESIQGIDERIGAKGEERAEIREDMDAAGGNKNRAVRATTGGLMAGAIASLLCNDSGVTAAAMILLFGFAWALAQADARLRVPSKPVKIAANEGE